MRITKVGLWFVVFTLITGLAATNTGNNALYMTLAGLLGTGAMAAIVGFANVRRLELELTESGEIYARSPATVGVTVRQRGAFPAWLLVLRLGEQSRPSVLTRVGGRGSADGVQHREQEVLFPERGRHRIDSVQISSLYPLGFFRVSKRLPSASELIVFPELFEAASLRIRDLGAHGDDSKDKPGRGFELHALRDFRAGDDPRHVHWKQTARTGRVIVQDRQTDDCRRLSLVLDNAVPPAQTVQQIRPRFEQLVSEAATAAVDYLGRGYEVELVCQDQRVPFGAGQGQKLAILEALALVQPVDAPAGALESSQPSSPRLRFSLSSPPDEVTWGASA